MIISFNMSSYMHALVDTCCMSRDLAGNTFMTILIELCTANLENSDIWPVIWLLTRCGN